MPRQFEIIDAFVTDRFLGNPAGVFLLDEPQPETWMQRVALELNQAETSFVVPQGSGYNLRWFTPNREIPLCGHATLAAAHAILSNETSTSAEPIVFQTMSGELRVQQIEVSTYAMDFPACPVPEQLDPNPYSRALGVEVKEAWASATNALVVVANQQVIESLNPNMNEIASFGRIGVIVTSLGNETADIVSRYFAPAAGVPEDPVTGSAHCHLGPFWAVRLGKKELLCHQLSPRGGEIKLQMVGERVILTGKAKTTVRGTYHD